MLPCHVLIDNVAIAFCRPLSVGAEEDGLAVSSEGCTEPTGPVPVSFSGGCEPTGHRGHEDSNRRRGLPPGRLWRLSGVPAALWRPLWRLSAGAEAGGALTFRMRDSWGARHPPAGAFLQCPWGMRVPSAPARRCWRRRRRRQAAASAISMASRLAAVLVEATSPRVSPTRCSSSDNLASFVEPLESGHRRAGSLPWRSVPLRLAGASVLGSRASAFG